FHAVRHPGAGRHDGDPRRVTHADRVSADLRFLLLVLEEASRRARGVSLPVVDDAQRRRRRDLRGRCAGPRPHPPSRTAPAGQESDGHDWYNLLSQWGKLNKDLIYAARMRVVAWIMFWVSTFGGLVAAWMSGRQPDATASSQT